MLRDAALYQRLSKQRCRQGDLVKHKDFRPSAREFWSKVPEDPALRNALLESPEWSLCSMFAFRNRRGVSVPLFYSKS